MVLGGHEKIADLLDVVGLNYSEDNIDGIRKDIPSGDFTGLKPHRLHGRVIAIFRDKEWIGDNRRVRNFEQSDYGNDRVPWGKTATAAWIVDRNRFRLCGSVYLDRSGLYR